MKHFSRDVTLFIVALTVLVLSAAAAPAKLTETCLTGTAPDVANDGSQILAVRAAVDAVCICSSFDGSKGKTHGGYVACAAGVIKTEADLGHLRTQCKRRVKAYYAQSTCGKNPNLHVEPCIATSLKSGKVTCAIKPTTKNDGTTASPACTDTARTTRVQCPAYTTCIDAADTDGNLIIAASGDTGACVLRQGDSCSDGTNCASHHCADGVCCDTACTDVCQACTAALTGGVDGVCAPISAPTACDDGVACSINDTCAAGTCAGTQITPNLHAAITKEIDSPPDAQDNIYLTVEITTVTGLPFELTATGLTFPPGFSLQSLGSVCSAEATDYKCRHTAVLLATTACSDDGNYQLSLTYSCTPDVSGCNLCSAPETIDFTLSNSNFCG